MNPNFKKVFLVLLIVNCSAVYGITVLETFDKPLDSQLFLVSANPAWDEPGNFYGVNSGKYVFSSENGIGGTDSWRYSWLRYSPTIIGDFDVKIDFTDFSPSLSNDYGYLMLMVETDVTSVSSIRIERYTSGGGGSGFLNYRTTPTGTNNFGTGQITPASNSNGRLRIVRNGNNFETYFSDGFGNYTSLGDINISGVNEVSLRVGYRVSQSWRPFSVSVDNLEIVYVPEPTTILLIGLGGLFLRRRK
jgi:hypothetical protein